MLRLSRNKKILLVIGLFLSLAFVPAPTHAACSPFDAECLISAGAAGIGSGLAEMVLTSLTLVQSLLLAGIVKMGGILTWVIGLRPDGGGAVVYGAWNILKEFCNMAFIVVLILTSFGTIFNTFQFEFLKPYSIYKKELVSAFLIAAIFMNFSLAIGQSIVALSNKVTDVMISIMPKNLGDQIAANLNVAQAVGSGKTPLANLGVQTSTGAPAPTPAPDQSSTTPTNDQQQTQNRLWEYAFQTNYLKCLDDSTLGAWANSKSCYTAAVQKMGKVPYPSAATAMQTQWSSGAGDPPSVTKIGGLWTMATGLGGQYTTSADYQASVVSLAQTPITGVGATLAKIPSLFYSIFLLLVLGLSFLCVIIFMVIRIPAIWVILVLSPLAWVGLMFPSSEASKKWWSQFMAWNLFSPLYLFMIYFGLYMLAQQPNLLAQLTRNGNPIDAQVGALLFYIMTGIIFVGGSATVASFAFKGGNTIASAAFGGISGALGIKGSFGAVGAVYRGTGMQAEIEGRYKGLASGLGSIQDKYSRKIFGAPSKERSETLERRYKTNFGTKDVAQADLRKRVTETMKKNADEGLSVKDMQEKFKDKSTGNMEKIALGRALLKEGALSTTEIKELSDSSQSLGDIGRNQVRQEIARKLSEQAKEKKFENAGDAQSAYMALSTPQEQERFLKDLKKNQIVEYSLLADQKISLREDAGLKPSEVLESRSASLGADDVPKILELAQQGKINMGPNSNVQYRMNDLLSKPENIQKARDSAARSPVAKQALTDLVQKINEDKKLKERTTALQSEQQEAIKEDRARSVAARTTPGPSSSGPTGTPPPSAPPPTTPPPTTPPPSSAAPRSSSPQATPRTTGSPRINLNQGRVDRTIRTAQNINRPSNPGTPRPSTPPTPPTRPPDNTSNT